MFISANTTGILTNTGPDLITTGVTGICLVSVKFFTLILF